MIVIKKITKQQSWIIFALFVVAVSIVLAYVAGRTNESVDQSQKAASNLSDSAGLATIEDKPTNLLKDAVLYDSNQEVTYKTLKLHVNSATASNVISYPLLKQSKTAENGVKFLLVNVTITNTTSTPINFEPFALLDDKGNLLNDAVSNDLTLIQYFEDSLLSRSLNPNVPETGNVLFKIPDSLHNGAIISVNLSTGKVTGVKINF